jgi:hypothetical protein
MKKVNIIIWDMMDILRDGNVNEIEYLKTCKECIDFNDIRFRVKNKINYISESFLKEQKSYKINRLVIIINKKIIDDIILLNIIKYFSFMYDEINIISNHELTYLKTHFNYDITIVFNDTLSDYKSKVIIEDNDTNLYKLFNITEKEIKIIL